jgi:hypothetical protein
VQQVAGLLACRPSPSPLWGCGRRWAGAVTAQEARPSASLGLRRW